jgi:hypothetical protein
LKCPLQKSKRKSLRLVLIGSIHHRSRFSKRKPLIVRGIRVSDSYNQVSNPQVGCHHAAPCRGSLSPRQGVRRYAGAHQCTGQGGSQSHDRINRNQPTRPTAQRQSSTEAGTSPFEGKNHAFANFLRTGAIAKPKITCQCNDVNACIIYICRLWRYIYRISHGESAS